MKTELVSKKWKIAFISLLTGFIVLFVVLLTAGNPEQPSKIGEITILFFYLSPLVLYLGVGMYLIWLVIERALTFFRGER